MTVTELQLLNPVFAIWTFLLGTLIGSFLNVVIYRLPLGRSIVAPSSACTTCNTPLPWWLNIPVFSYIMLGGRCRFCGSGYSARYALLELFTGLFFLFTHLFKAQVWTGLFWKTAVLFCFCLVVFFIDYDHWIIPDGVNLAGTVAGLGFALALPLSSKASTALMNPIGSLDPMEVSRPLAELINPSPDPLPPIAWALIGGVFGYAFFWSIQIVGLLLAKQEAMGGGDVKFAVVLGAFLGPSTSLFAFLGSFFLGALFAVPLILAKRGGGKDPIPFGTFMAASAVIFQFFGTERIIGPLQELLTFPM